MNRTFRATMLAGVSLCALLSAGPASAQQSANERTYRQEALAHARAVTTAWRRLESYILEGSAGTPDPAGTSVSGWSGEIPPAASGWLAGWTLRGVRARYCEDTLLVYLAPERLKGVGRDHRAVQAAPHAYAGGALGQAPVLHWLEAGRATGAAGRPSVTLPACLSDSAFGGPLPSGRAALAGTVRDPYTHTNERVSRERQLEDCAAGEHGQGRTRVREITQTHDERGNPVGDPVHGPWQLLIDECRADYTAWEHYTLACHWDAGPPHNRRMEGREIWRRMKSVTAEGETLGPPEFVSTSCWTGKVPVPPTAVVTETAQTEAMTDGCPSGYTGSQDYRRTATHRATQFPWDAEPVVQISYGPWILETDSCQAVIPPDWMSAAAMTAALAMRFLMPTRRRCRRGRRGRRLRPRRSERRGIEAERADPDRAAALPRRLHDENEAPGAGCRILRTRAPHFAASPRHSDWDWIGRIDAAIAAIAAGDEDGFVYA